MEVDISLVDDTEHEQEIEYLSHDSQRGEREIYDIVGMP